MKNSAKYLLNIADSHVGSETGLTSTPKNRVQEQLLDKFNECRISLGEPDILIVNGDLIDGDQRKSGGQGLTEGDINKQEDDAVSLIQLLKPKEVFLISGTSYHVGVVSSENNIANKLNRYCGIKATYVHKLHLLVNGWFKLQARHFISGSNTPQGRSTAPGRAKMWEVLNAYQSGDKASDISLFAHVHYYDLHQNAFGTTVILPCFQAMGTPYGDEKCDGHIDIGMFKVVVEPTREEGWSWEKKLYSAKIKSKIQKR